MSNMTDEVYEQHMKQYGFETFTNLLRSCYEKVWMYPLAVDSITGGWQFLSAEEKSMFREDLALNIANLDGDKTDWIELQTRLSKGEENERNKNH